MLRSDSVPRRALLVAVRTATLCASASTLKELQEVLRRPKLNAFLPLSDRDAFFALVSRYTQLWEVPASSEQAAAGVCRDQKDAKFLALALTCRADVLISSDADLLVLHSWQGIPILTPAAFLEQAST
jgi:putative PIN family toxin of toxin-antitoxin system